jgi:hypothetical protein
VSDVDRAAWDRFLEVVETVRPAMDGTVPVAMVCIASIGGGDADSSILRIVWHPAVPVDARLRILRQIGEKWDQGLAAEGEGLAAE